MNVATHFQGNLASRGGVPPLLRRPVQEQSGQLLKSRKMASIDLSI